MGGSSSSAAAPRGGSASRSATNSPPIKRARNVMARFRRPERIRRRAEFQRVYEEGVRVHSRTLTLFLLPSGGATGRLGVAATKKLGGAVERNRAKRLIREVFRRNKVAPGFDVVIVPKRELLGASLAALELEYQQTLERAFRRRRTATSA